MKNEEKNIIFVSNREKIISMYQFDKIFYICCGLCAKCTKAA